MWGALLSPKGIEENAYYWGLGIASNNKAKSLAVWLGLKLALDQVIRHSYVVEDYGDHSTHYSQHAF